MTLNQILLIGNAGRDAELRPRWQTSASPLTVATKYATKCVKTPNGSTLPLGNVKQSS